MSGFGDVFAPSRAVDDDEEDEEGSDCTGTNSSSVIRWSPKARSEMETSEKHNLPCKVLVVAVGQAATGFTQSHIMLNRKTETLGVLCSGTEDKLKSSLSQHAISDRTCYIYRLSDNPGVIICLCNTTVTPEQSFSWTEEVFQGLDTSNCYTAVLASTSVADYVSEKSTSDLATPFLRSLKSTKFHGQPSVTYLEQPNTVKGLPAQILSYCQVRGVPAVLFLCYSDVIHLDILTMQAFRPLLQSTPIKDLVQSVDLKEAHKSMATLVAQHLPTSSLYI